MKKSTLQNINNTVGKTFESNGYGRFTVIRYEHYTRVYIQFENTGGLNMTDMYSIREGCVVDLLAKTNYGVGYIGYGYDNKCKDSRNRVWEVFVDYCYYDCVCVRLKADRDFNSNTSFHLPPIVYRRSNYYPYRLNHP